MERADAKGARVAIHKAKVIRWSTFALECMWDRWGQMARAEPGGRPMLTWKNLRLPRWRGKRGRGWHKTTEYGFNGGGGGRGVHLPSLTWSGAPVSRAAYKT